MSTEGRQAETVFAQLKSPTPTGGMAAEGRSYPLMFWRSSSPDDNQYFNKHWLNFTGQASEREFVHAWQNTVSAQERMVCQQSFLKAWEDRRPFSLEFRVTAADGRQRWILDSGQPRYSPDGTFGGYTGVCIDVTEKKRAEARLEQIEQLSEISGHAKSVFLSNISFELRNSMNGVLGMVNLLMDTDLNDEQLEYAKLVQGSVDSLMVIISDILDFSRFELGKFELVKMPFDLCEAFEDMGDFLATRAQEKRINFAIRVAPDAPRHIVGDPFRIRQIIVNLLTNALEYTDSGSVTMNVTCEGRNGNDATLRFAVEDTGPGIPAEMMERLFEKGFSAKAAKDGAPGNGTHGLYVCKQLAKMMGGDVEAQSRPEEGSLFTVTLPVQLAPPSALGTEQPDPILAGTRVLVVEDRPINQKIFYEQLSAANIRHTIVMSSQEALTELRMSAKNRDPYHVVVLDFWLPGMDGISLGRLIKNDPALKDARLMMLTTSCQRGDTKRFERAGFDAYLVKPLSQFRLVDALAVMRLNHARNISSMVTRKSLLDLRRRSHGLSVAKPKRPLQHRVLVAEDNEINCMVTIRLLEKLGFTADTAKNGMEALKMAMELPYDAILMDCDMPELDGFEATREIRAREDSDNRTPIIALTAIAMSGDRERCIQAGMDDYLAKPVSYEDLKETLEHWLPADAE